MTDVLIAPGYKGFALVFYAILHDLVCFIWLIYLEHVWSDIPAGDDFVCSVVEQISIERSVDLGGREPMTVRDELDCVCDFVCDGCEPIAQVFVVVLIGERIHFIHALIDHVLGEFCGVAIDDDAQLFRARTFRIDRARVDEEHAAGKSCFVVTPV